MEKAACREQRIDRIIHCLIIALVFLFPFQKRYAHKLKSFSCSLIPEDLILPRFFSKRIDFYSTDLLILGIVILCLYQFRDRLRTLFFDGPSKWLFAFVGVAALSIAASPAANYVLQYYRLSQLSLFVLFFASLSFFLQCRDRGKLIEQIFWALFFVSMIQCGIGIVQYFLQHSIGLKSLGEPNISHYSFASGDTKLWLFDHASTLLSEKILICRASGTLPHPNIMGGFIVVSLLSTCYLIIKEERVLLRNLLYGGVVLQIATLLITFSRAAILAMILSLCVWMGIAFYKRGVVPLSKRLIFLCVAILTFVTCLLLFYNQLRYRGGIINYNQTTLNADRERIIYQKVAWEMFKEHPLLGVGFNNFQIYSPQYLPKDISPLFFAKVHNIYLLVLAETGILGLLCFSLFLFSLIKSIRLTDERVKVICAIGIGVLFIGGCDYYWLHAPHGKLLFFLIAALLVPKPHPILYCARSDLVNLDSARQSQIEAQRSDRRSLSPRGKGKAAETLQRSGGPLQCEAGEVPLWREPGQDRFGKVAASPNSPNLTEGSIVKEPV